MQYKREVVENTVSIEHINHVYVINDEEERENVLQLIKAKHPGADIQLTRTGFLVKEIRKKSDKEKEAYAKEHKKDDYMAQFEEDVAKIKGKKKV